MNEDMNNSAIHADRTSIGNMHAVDLPRFVARELTNRLDRIESTLIFAYDDGVVARVSLALSRLLNAPGHVRTLAFDDHEITVLAAIGDSLVESWEPLSHERDRHYRSLIMTTVDQLRELRDRAQKCLHRVDCLQ